MKKFVKLLDVLKNIAKIIHHIQDQVRRSIEQSSIFNPLACTCESNISADIRICLVQSINGGNVKLATCRYGMEKVLY